MNCTHGSTAHMRPGDKCAYCGSLLTADDIVVAAPHGATRVAPVADGGASLAPVVSSGHGIARPDGSAPPPHPVGSTSAPEVAADRKDAAGSSFPGFTASGAISLFDGPLEALERIAAHLEPTARSSNPATAHAAAASITPDKQRDSHQLVLRLLAEHGPLSDFDLARLASAARGHMVKQTSIGVRRKELVRAGAVYMFDGLGVSDTGSPCIRWALNRTEVAA